MAYSREKQIQDLLPPPPEPKEQPTSDPDNSSPPDVADEDSQPAEPLEEPQHKLSPEQQQGMAQIAQALQTENVDRGERIAQLIQAALAKLPEENDTKNPPADASQTDPTAEQTAAQRQQLAMATQFLDLAREEMKASLESLGEATERKQPGDDETQQPSDPATPLNDRALASSREHVGQAVEHFQSLRRLFFSVIEHLRETAQRQAN